MIKNICISLVTATLLGLLITGVSDLHSSPVRRNQTGAVSSFFFDMGHPDTPVFDGFLQITADSLYNQKTGYGWINRNRSNPNGKFANLTHRLPETPNRKPYPDDLVGDYVFWGGGSYPLQFRVDVPDGKYHVWIYMGMFDEPSKFREYAYYNISVNSITKVEARRRYLESVYQGPGCRFA
jgi:hypothetical protein